MATYQVNIRGYFQANIDTFDQVVTSVCEYASGRVQDDGGEVRIGQVVRFDLANPLAAGTHEIARLDFHELVGSGDARVTVESGLYVAEGGESGQMQIGTITAAPDVDSDNGTTPASFWAVVAPNPFNPTTTIRYGIPRTDHVMIAIYSPSGRRLRVLVDEMIDAGTYETVWDGRTNLGGEAASGVYFCAIQAGAEKEIRKLTVLR